MEAEIPLPQLFVPITVTFPDEAVAEKSTVMVMIEVLLLPVMVAPGGTVQVYPVAPGMAAME